MSKMALLSFVLSSFIQADKVKLDRGNLVLYSVKAMSSPVKTTLDPNVGERVTSASTTGFPDPEVILPVTTPFGLT
jgi:hypothetical protein